MTRPWIRIASLAVAAALSGCAPSTLPFEPLAGLKAPLAARYPRSPAVILKKEDGVIVYVGQRERSQRLLVHEVRAILTEAGLTDWATVKLTLRDNERLSAFQARSISPDGTVHPVEGTQLFAASSRLGTVLDDDNKDIDTRAFRFPDARVGSILEFSYTVDAAQFGAFVSRRIDRQLPIEKYLVSVEFSERIRGQVSLHNSSVPVVEHKGFSSQGYSFELGPLPAVETEPASPPWRETELWWVSRVGHVQYPTTQSNWADDWPTALAFWARYIVLPDGVAKGAEKIQLSTDEVSRCHGDHRCLIDVALAATRDRAELTGFGEAKDRRLVDVVSSGHASNREKALLLRHLLVGAGVKALPALLTRGVAGAYEPEQPNPFVFDHIVIYVPEQAGISSALFLDPSCERCAAGEVPSWDVDANALVVTAEDHALGAFELKTHYMPVTGAPRREDEIHRSFVLTVAASGDAEAEEIAVARGDTALELRVAARSLTDQQLREAAEKMVAERHASARLRDQSLKCDRALGTCSDTLHFTLPGYAAVDGARLLVPLTVFNPTTLPAPDAPLRKNDFVYATDHTIEETLTIKLPPGYTVAELPPDVHITSPTLHAVFEARTQGDTVIVRRQCQNLLGRFPASVAPKVADAMRSWAGLRNGSVVLQRSEGVR